MLGIKYFVEHNTATSTGLFDTWLKKIFIHSFMSFPPTILFYVSLLWATYQRIWICSTIGGYFNGTVKNLTFISILIYMFFFATVLHFPFHPSLNFLSFLSQAMQSVLYPSIFSSDSADTSTL